MHICGCFYLVFFTIYCWFVEQVICFSAGRKSQRLIYQVWNSWHYRVKDTFHTHNQTDVHWWILVEQTLQHHPLTHHTAVQCYQCTLIPQQTSSVTGTASVLFPCTKNISKAIKNESFTIFLAVCGIVLKCFWNKNTRYNVSVLFPKKTDGGRATHFVNMYKFQVREKLYLSTFFLIWKYNVQS